MITKSTAIPWEWVPGGSNALGRIEINWQSINRVSGKLEKGKIGQSYDIDDHWNIYFKMFNLYIMEFLIDERSLNNTVVWTYRHHIFVGVSEFAC